MDIIERKLSILTYCVLDGKMIPLRRSKNETNGI